MVVHGEKAHSRYFGETAYRKLKGDNKELVIVPGANHCDLYDGITAERSEGRAERGDSRGESREPSGKDAIPFDRIEAFYRKNLK